MSEKNRDAKRAARERLIEEREKQKARDRRKRGMIVGGSVVGVLALAAVIGVVAANSGSDSGSDSASSPLTVPSGATGKDSLAVPVGASDAPSTLTVWEDFRCPACGQFENGFRSTIHELENSGQLKVEYHLATLIDSNMGGTGSLRAANAAACAQDERKFPAYHDVLYENQPEETTDPYAQNSKLIELAGKVKGLKTAAFTSCVNGGKHDSWVKRSNAAFQKGGFSGTPTVELNGSSVFPKKGNEQISPANLKKWVTEANQGKKAGTVSPAPAA